MEEERAGQPTRVLHIRGLPDDFTEGEVVKLGLPFGRMTNMVMFHKKNQASYFYNLSAALSYKWSCFYNGFAIYKKRPDGYVKIKKKIGIAATKFVCFRD